MIPKWPQTVQDRGNRGGGSCDVVAVDNNNNLDTVCCWDSNKKHEVSSGWISFLKKHKKKMTKPIFTFQIFRLLILSIIVINNDVGCRDLNEQTMLEIMMRTLSVEAGGSRRMDPLLRQLMVTALQRSQDERDKNNLTPPNYRQDPLLRQLMDNVVDTFADMVLELPPRAQDHLLK